jgi:hypothetical protein
MNLPSASRSEPRTSPETEPEQNDRTARLNQLLARADQAAQRIAAQQAERQGSSQYAARMELEVQTRAEAGQQAESQGEVELEPLRRSTSALSDKPADQSAQQSNRLCFAPIRPGQDPARQVRHRRGGEQAVKAADRRSLRRSRAHRAGGNPRPLRWLSIRPRSDYSSPAYGHALNYATPPSDSGYCHNPGSYINRMGAGIGSRHPCQ